MEMGIQEYIFPLMVFLFITNSCQFASFLVQTMITKKPGSSWAPMRMALTGSYIAWYLFIGGWMS